MLNRYPLWKNAVVLFFLALGLLYALPNLYPQDPALQITGRSATIEMSDRVLTRAVAALEEKGIEVLATESNIDKDGAGSVIVRLKEGDDQLPGQSAINETLGGDYVVALNRLPTTPGWLASIGGKPMSLGLDLAGGVHFLLEVDIESAVSKTMETSARELRRQLREEDYRYRNVSVNANGEVVARFNRQDYFEGAIKVATESFPRFVQTTEESGENFVLRLNMAEAERDEIIENAMAQNLNTLRKRVNEIGVSEPLVQRQGANRIVVELPGVQDPAIAKRIIGRTANLEFRLEAESGTPITQRKNFAFRGNRGGSAWLIEDIIVTGDNVQQAFASFSQQTSEPEVNITLSGDGGARMSAATLNNVGRSMGVVFIEYITEEYTRKNAEGKDERAFKQRVEESLISLARINSPLGANFVITGLDSPAEAQELALLLKAGALAAPMYIVEDRTIGPSLGEENIRLGVLSIQIGMMLVVVFMLVYYRVFGIAANIALTMNLILLTAFMSLFGATLTLPGIAGIVLTLGMAVDANVLIFSRIKEELKEGVSPQQAINSGFERAVVTILDANITTLIVALILFAIGSGPVKGFAITLSIGIVTSMFTAIMGTRSLINLIYGGRKVQKLWI